MTVDVISKHGDVVVCSVCQEHGVEQMWWCKLVTPTELAAAAALLLRVKVALEYPSELSRSLHVMNPIAKVPRLQRNCSAIAARL